MSNFKGKRMVDEDLIKKLEDLQPGGGTEYTAGDGISINDDVLSVNYGTGLTVDDGTLIIDSSTVAIKNDLATVATTGAYSDLSGTPTLATVATTGDYDDLSGTPTLATVATTGDYDDLTNKPTIPETPLVLTQASGTLSDADYAKLDEDTIIQYNDSTVTRLYYFYSDTTTQIEYRTNPIFVSSTTGNVYRFIVTKADKSYGLNYSLGYNLLPTMPGDGNFKLTASRSGSTVTPPAWKLDYPDPDTSAAGSFNLEATVDAQGGVTYDWAAGGSGSSYTFTDGLTESSGTVSWDLNDMIVGNTTNKSLTINLGTTPLVNNATNSIYVGPGYSTAGSLGEHSSYMIVLGENKIADYTKDSAVLGQHNTLTCESGAWPFNSYNRGIFVGGYNNTITRSNSNPPSYYNGSVVLGVNNEYTYKYGPSVIIGHCLQATTTDEDTKVVLGKFNLDGNYLFQLGNGSDSSNRSNAMTVSTDGTIVSKNLPAVDTTTDGTYVLKATVSSGVVTYAWVLES